MSEREPQAHGTAQAEPGVYFALPRLCAHWRGRSARRSERNWLEANIAGTLVHLVVYASAFQLLLARQSLWRQVLLCLPLALLVWVFWLLLLYANSLVIRSLRAVRLMRHLPDRRAQTALICILTAVFAVRLLTTGAWGIGAVWLAVFALNLLAAALLAISQTDVAAAE